MSDYDPSRPVDPSPRVEAFRGLDRPSLPRPMRDSTADSRLTASDDRDRPVRRPRSGSNSHSPDGDAVGGGPVSFETLLSLAGDARRRRLLSILRSVDGPVSVRSLADDLVDRRDDPVGDGARRAIEISLVHDHLPRLASLGLIDYDRARRRVRPSAAFRSLDGHLETLLGSIDDGVPEH